MEGEALRIELDDRGQKIELSTARVNRGGDEVAGDYIFVDQRSDFYQVSSGKSPAAAAKAVIQVSDQRRSWKMTSSARRGYASATSRAPWWTSRSRSRAARSVGLLGPNGAGKTTCFYDRRTDPGRPGAIHLDSASSRICRSTGARASASPICRRRTRCSAGSRWKRTCRRFSSCRDSHRRKSSRASPSSSRISTSHLRKHAAISLSGGERRRLEIARALGTRPAFILLDEPFAGVDPIAVLDIQRIIRFLKERRIGVLADHNVRETLGICDRAYIINEAPCSPGHPGRLSIMTAFAEYIWAEISACSQRVE